MEDPSTPTSRDVANNETATALLSRSQVVRIAVCGFLMGGADVIPGVSGGTVALMLGIYQRLVTAISHCDLELWSHVRRKHWRAALAHLDFYFLEGMKF